MAPNHKAAFQGKLKGGSKNCCGGGCKHQQITTRPGKNQAIRLSPQGREALELLQRSLAADDLTTISASHACQFLLRNY
jgi:hypothetical protein